MTCSNHRTPVQTLSAILLSALLVPLIGQAQYTGGNGRGDVQLARVQELAYFGGQGRGDAVFAFVPPVLHTLVSGTIAGSPLCAGSAFSIPYTATGTYSAPNIFTAQLSDSSGSFASPVDIGTLASTTSGNISATIPLTALAGSSYRIRVVSSDPPITGTDNGSDLSIETPTTWYQDLDGDGFGDPANSVESCDGPIGFVLDNTDCLDNVFGANIGAACDDGDPSTIYDVITEFCTCQGVPGGVRVNVQVLLEATYSADAQLMRDDLRAQGLIPLVEPYTALGYTFLDGGGETTTTEVLNGSGMGDQFMKVDWVIVELRSAIDPSVIVSSRAGLVQREGTIAGGDGLVLFFDTLPPGPYHVAVQHRNHLGVMTSDPVALSFNVGSPVDFTDRIGSLTTFGTNAQKDIPGTFAAKALWAGDVGFDGIVKYTGEFNDRDQILQAIGGTVATNSVTGYLSTDVNLDGVVKYTGLGNDRDPILVNIGGRVATNVLEEQVP